MKGSAHSKLDAAETWLGMMGRGLSPLNLSWRAFPTCRGVDVSTSSGGMFYSTELRGLFDGDFIKEF